MSILMALFCWATMGMSFVGLVAMFWQAFSPVPMRTVALSKAILLVLT